MAKQVIHASKGKSLSTGEARENERLNWDEKSYRAKNENVVNNYDWSRRRLNFEIKEGKVIPLGSQSTHLFERYQAKLDEIDFKQYKDSADNQQHTYVEIIFSGDTEVMRKLAFGDQHVDYERNPQEWKNWNVTRTEAILEWALDCYKFASERYGKENIIGFEVHLDETSPHIHCNIVPTALMQQRGNISGYHKVDENENPVVYTKGKHIGEVIKISAKKYEVLSEEKKKEYRPNERGTVRTISYGKYFGRTLAEREQKMVELHDQFYEQVSKKWGMERGDRLSMLPPEERKKHKHRSKEQAYYLKKADKDRAIAEEGARQAAKQKDAVEKSLGKIVEEKKMVMKELDVMRSVKTTPFQRVETYVKPLSSLEFSVPKDVLEKMNSPLRNHPRVLSGNPPLTVKELENIAMEEIDKIYNNSGLTTSRKTLLNHVREIFTDKETILFDVVDFSQRAGIAKANKELYKEIKKTSLRQWKRR